MAEEKKEENEKAAFLEGFEDVNTFTQQASRMVMQALRCSNGLPMSGDDFDYYSSFDSFRSLMDIEGSRILSIIQDIMRYHGAKGNLSTSSTAVELEEKFDVLIDANDQMLEKAGTYLDEAAGLRKNEAPLVVATMTSKSPISGSWNKKTLEKRNSKASSFRLLAAKNIQRPQTKFKEKVDNSTKPFVPKIKHKPHGAKSLHDSLMFTGDPNNVDENFIYPHPYQFELDHFVPSKEHLARDEPIRPPPIDETTLKIVSTAEDLSAMMEDLKTNTIIAVDLEHHSYRTYMGFTCLIQISTRDCDYIVDALELRSELEVLNEVFTDPAVIKVMHGADMDIQWLQRDFGVYVVNMFDSGQASKVLGFSRHSLAHLLSHYCQVSADKQFQLADWRIRPLPDELVKYAREDTHFLLYIYDKMKCELLDRSTNHDNLLVSVIDRSTHVCATRYQKPKNDDSQHMALYMRSRKTFNNQQMAAFKGIFSWRDKTGRVEDESPGYILPNHMLLQIAATLPKEPQGILACCNPIPPLVRQNLNELHLIVKAAREVPLSTPEKPKIPLGPQKTEHPKYNVNSILHCPHDSTYRDKLQNGHSMEVDESIVAPKSTLFKDPPNILDVTMKTSPTITAFSSPTKNVNTSSQKKAERIIKSIVNPFERYLSGGLSRSTPAPIDATLSLDTGTQGLLGYMWKMLPHTEKPKPKPKPIPQPENIVTGDIVECKGDEEERDANVINLSKTDDNTPLRQQEKSKKRKSEPSAGEKFEPPAQHEFKRQKKKVDAPELEIKPFDYSQTDYNVFQASTSNKKGKHNRQYDPDAEQMSTKYKTGSSRGRNSSRFGSKSMTYDTQKGKNFPKMNWPKR